jgi:hypothetical protein
MSVLQQSSKHGALILLGIGLISLFCGLVVLTQRETVTALFFGTGPSLDLAATNIERLKILYVDCGAVIAMAQGTILFVVGLFRLARTERAWGSATTPASR